MADIATWTANGNRNRPNICAGVHGAGCEKHSISRIESALIFMTGMGSKFVRRETTYSRVVAGSTQAESSARIAASGEVGGRKGSCTVRIHWPAPVQCSSNDVEGRQKHHLPSPKANRSRITRRRLPIRLNRCIVTHLEIDKSESQIRVG